MSEKRSDGKVAFEFDSNTLREVARVTFDDLEKLERKLFEMSEGPMDHAVRIAFCVQIVIHIMGNRLALQRSITPSAFELRETHVRARQLFEQVFPQLAEPHDLLLGGGGGFEVMAARALRIADGAPEEPST